MSRAIGILGGTFDPIHYGHLLAGQEALTHYDLEQVIFIPSARPPHKLNHEVSAPEARYEMTVLATANNPAFIVSRLEIDRNGPSYTADTLEQLRREFGEETRFYLILGADALLELPTWHEPTRIIAQAEFIVVTRPGITKDQLTRESSSDLLARVHLLPIPELAISSTELRRRAAAGESLRYLTPQAVIQYLLRYGLYQGKALNGDHT